MRCAAVMVLLFVGLVVGRAADGLPKHWAFQPVRKPLVKTQHGEHPIDTLLGTAHVAAADPRTLIRRMTYDLTGLPPTSEEVDAFMRACSSVETRAAATNQLIDRLLASPAYGEKWGRKWLDVARYADTAGENTDRPLHQAWRYRNYVIAVFNRDMPYDQFVREQIAGDLLASADPQRYPELIEATGYLAIARRFGHEIDKDMHLTYEDVIDTLGKSVLGLSLGCARCHNHKYDPISTRDYYGLYGIFSSTKFAYPGCENTQKTRDLMPLWTADEMAVKRKPFDVELAAIEAAIKNAAGAPTNTLRLLNADRAALIAREPKVPVAYAVAEGTPADAPLQKRGEPDQPGDITARKNLDLLGGETISNSEASGRLELARWLTDPKNPLTARVMVNRLWQGHFGRGIVATPSDFGTRGATPTNPELLDWLAASFTEHGWSVKMMHRIIMTSAAYQQSSAESGTHSDLAPFPRRRLEAEEIRDTLLMLSGELDRTPGEGHPFPAENSNFTQHTPFKAVYESKKRSVYLMTQRIQRHPFLALFDGPDTNASTAQRGYSTVPTQALYFINDPFFHARSETFAKRLISACPTMRARVTEAHRLCFQREPTATEAEQAEQFVQSYGRAVSETDSSRELTIWSAYARTLLASNELLYVE